MKKYFLLLLLFPILLKAQLSDAIFIAPSGNVGIGTSQPQKALDVAGDIAGKGMSCESLNISDDIFLGNRASHGSISFVFENADNSWRIWASGNRPSHGGLGNENMEFWNYNSTGKFPRFVIENSTLRKTLTLRANGDLHISGVVKSPHHSTIQNSVVAFGGKEKLLPLKELELFIQNEKRLPDVPLRSDWEKEALSLNQLQVLNLEKIESLTLYVIELKKENDALRKNQEVLMEKMKELENQNK